MLLAQLTQNSQLLRQSLNSSFCLITTLGTRNALSSFRETDTYLGCRRDPSSWALARSAGRQLRLALASRDLHGSTSVGSTLRHRRSAERHQHSAIFRVPTAKHSSFPRHFPRIFPPV